MKRNVNSSQWVSSETPPLSCWVSSCIQCKAAAGGFLPWDAPNNTSPLWLIIFETKVFHLTFLFFFTSFPSCSFPFYYLLFPSTGFLLGCFCNQNSHMALKKCLSGCGHPSLHVHSLCDSGGHWFFRCLSRSLCPPLTPDHHSRGLATSHILARALAVAPYPHTFVLYL